MEVKKEPLDMMSEKTMTKEELMFTVPPTTFKVEQQSDNPAISPTNLFEIKKEPRETDEMCFEIPTDEVKEVHASDFYVKISELDKIIKQEAKVSILPKTEFLTTNCDLPTIKSDNFEELNRPCSSKQSQKLLKQSKKNVLKKKKYPCPICQKRYQSSNARRKHLGRHFGKGCVTCKFCGKIFISKFNFLKHLFIHFVKRKRKVLKTLTTLPSKNKIHAGEELFKCKICSKEFPWKNYLYAHMAIHSHKNLFQCDICQKRFNQKQSLNRHLKLRHTGQKPYMCEICSKQFGIRSILRQHMTTHSNQKQYKCEICSKEFVWKLGFSQHMMVHLGQKPFKCDICSKEFTWRNSFLAHLVTHSDQKTFKCDTCLKYFKTKSNLTSHKKVHIAQKPFECEICFKTFTQKSNLKTHLKSHKFV